MKQIFTFFAALCYFSVAAFAIGIDEDETPVTIMAVGAQSNRGVYTLGTTGEFAPVKLSGSTMIQYDFTGSGGTFTDRSTLYGSKDAGYSIYAGKATAEGGEDGPWSHVVWAYRSGLTPLTYEVLATDMTFDFASRRIYGWFMGDNKGTKYHLGIYDGEARAATAVGADSSVKLTALAADAEGVLWGIDGASGKLYTVDTTDGSLTLRGTLTVTSAEAGQSAAIDPASGTLYWGTGTALWKVNCADASATKIYDFGSGQTFNAFFIPEPEIKKGAPAEVTDLKGEFTAEGMNVTFTAPDKTVGGSALSGPLTYTLLLDGAELATGSINAGEAYTGTHTMDEGEHAIAVYCANSQGNGPRASTTAYYGFDTPGAVRSLAAAVSGRNVTLTWEAPAGQNGGVVDVKALTYTVTRTPGNVTLATALTECAYTDALPDGPIAEYTYTVSVIGGKSTSAEPVLVGEAHTVPYVETFDSADSFAAIAYATIDLDPGTDSWLIARDADGNGYASIKGTYPDNRRDYLVSAPIHLLPGVTYTLAFDARNVSVNHDTALDIFVSRTRSAEQTVQTLVEGLQLPIVKEGAKFAPYDYTFTVPDEADYHIGFYDHGDYYTTNVIHIDNISVSAPASISEIGAEAAGTVRYFDLQGRAVAHPSTSGIYILSTPSKTVKIRL